MPHVKAKLVGERNRRKDERGTSLEGEQIRNMNRKVKVSVTCEYGGGDGLM